MTIQLRQVAKRFGSFTAVDTVSFDIPSGSLTALLGPSGSGKSTLLRIIGGLETPDRGAILFDGRDVTGAAPQSRGIGFVFQQYAVFPYMNVWENIAFGLQVRKLPRDTIDERVRELLALTELDGLAARYPAQLSGGQQQRVALARALAVRPSVLLLDEPFAALDTRVRKDLREWLRQLHSDLRVTTVLVTHDQEEAMSVADRIVVIKDGRVQQVGPPLDLYEQPTSAFVMSFLGPVTRVAGAYVRPHDLAVRSAPTATTSREAVVERVTVLGFEVHLDLRLVEGDERVWAQLARNDLATFQFTPGQHIFVDVTRSKQFGDR